MEQMKKNWALYGVIIVLMCIVGFMSSEYVARRNQISPTTTPKTEPTTHMRTYKNTTVGFSFQYPNDIFTVTSTDSTVDLESPYYIEDNYKGTPDGGYRHPFALHFEYQKLPVLEAIKNTPSMGTSFMSSFPKKTLESFMDDGDYAVNFVAGGKNGYAFTVGVEGTNAKYVYLPVNESETLFIQMTYFTDFLKDAVKPVPFSEEMEMKAFSDVVQSLKFNN